MKKNNYERKNRERKRREGGNKERYKSRKKIKEKEIKMKREMERKIEGQGQLTVKVSSNRMLPRFQKLILGQVRLG